MWWKILLILIVLAAAVLLYGVQRWKSHSAELFQALDQSLQQNTPTVYDPSMTDSLPDPVKRYLEKVLKNGQPIVASLSLQQSGTFNMSQEDEQWKPFSAEQNVTASRPGFVWNAKINMLPGLAVYVHDAYVAGEGILEASLLGLFTVMEMRDTPEIARGELMRFVAEAPLYPSVLLPRNGLSWQPVDSTSARAVFKDGASEVALTFHFNRDDLVESVTAEKRDRTVNGKSIPAPWQGGWWAYEEHGGMLVPTEGEVAWLLPEGRLPYWRGKIKNLQYTFAGE